MRPVYGDKCFTRPAIHVWCTKFARGRESMVDKERPGRHAVATTDATIAAVDAFVQSDRHVSISDIVRHTGVSRDSVHRIVRNHLKFRKVSARYSGKYATVTTNTISRDRYTAIRILNWLIIDVYNPLQALLIVTCCILTY